MGSNKSHSGNWGFRPGTVNQDILGNGAIHEWADSMGGTGGGTSGGATEVTQQAILNELQLQNSFSENIWVDDTGTYYIRVVSRDPSTGVETISYTLPDGTAYTPVLPASPVGGNDIQTQISQYIVINNGAGYSVGDFITQTLLLETVSPYSVLATVYYNNTTGTVITPVFTDLKPYPDAEFVEPLSNDYRIRPIAAGSVEPILGIQPRRRRAVISVLDFPSGQSPDSPIMLIVGTTFSPDRETGIVIPPQIGASYTISGEFLTYLDVYAYCGQDVRLTTMEEWD